MADKVWAAKDLDDDAFVAAIQQDIAEGITPTAYSVNARYPDVPHKVIRAKITALGRKGRVEGCGSGCDCGSPLFLPDARDDGPRS